MSQPYDPNAVPGPPTQPPASQGPPPGYPPQAAPGYPPQGAPGYPPQAAPGYPSQGAPGYPPQGAPGYPPQGAPGYPPPQPQAPLSPHQDIAQNKGFAILAYFLFFVPLLMGTHRTSPYVKFHTNQGLIMFILGVGWGIVYGILMAIITPSIFASPAAWSTFQVISVLIGLLWLVPLALLIIGVINAASGQFKRLPVIGQIELIK
jgi:uncharacterized membrane protein